MGHQPDIAGAIRLFEQTLVALEGGKQLPPEVRDWLMHGFRQFYAGGDLLDGLGLRPPRYKPGMAVGRLIPQARRDRRIIAAAAPLRGEIGTRAGVLARALEKWPEAVPKLPAESRAHLAALARECGEVPALSRPTVTRILEGDTTAQRVGLVSAA